MGIRGLNRVFDGNMKELWDFNRSSVKSYLFFLIYLKHAFCVFLKTPEINQLEKAKKNTFVCFFRLEIKNGHFVNLREWLERASRSNRENQRA